MPRDMDITRLPEKSQSDGGQNRARSEDRGKGKFDLRDSADAAASSSGPGGAADAAASSSGPVGAADAAAPAAGSAEEPPINISNFKTNFIAHLF
jgi:hypothetical protein